MPDVDFSDNPFDCPIPDWATFTKATCVASEKSAEKEQKKLRASLASDAAPLVQVTILYFAVLRKRWKFTAKRNVPT